MGTAVEYGLRAIAGLVVFLALLQIALLLIGTSVGILVLFTMCFTIVRASSSGAVLLAVDFLSPQTLNAAGLLNLLWLVGPASLLSVVLFDLTLDGPVLWLLRRMRLNELWVGVGEVVVGGLVAALMLKGSAHFVHNAAVLPVSLALVTGIICSFVLYCVELLSLDTDLRKVD